MPVKFVNFLKSGLIVVLFNCFLMFVNKLFTYFTCPISQRKSCFNLRHIIFIWRQRYCLIFKSALVYLKLLSATSTRFINTLIFASAKFVRKCNAALLHYIYMGNFTVEWGVFLLILKFFHATPKKASFNFSPCSMKHFHRR